jgi:hypothetical protein
MTEMIEFLRPELIILVAVLWALGKFLKLAPWFRDEWAIPFILLGTSEVLTVVYVAIVVGDGFTASGVVASLVQGVIVASLAVFGNEAIKQITTKRLEDEQ